MTLWRIQFYCYVLLSPLFFIFKFSTVISSDFTYSAEITLHHRCAALFAYTIPLIFYFSETIGRSAVDAFNLKINVFAMDKRKYERFIIELPARLETITSNKRQVFGLVTKNISASGAFISTNSPFIDGSRIKMSLTTQNKRLAELTGSQCLIECEGSIVRTTTAGVAICFDTEFQIMSLKSE